MSISYGRYFMIFTVMLCACVFSAFGQALSGQATGSAGQSSKKLAPSETGKSGRYATYYSGDLQFEIDLDSVQRNGNIAYFWEKLTLSEKARREYIDAQLDIIKRSHTQGIPQDIYEKWKGYRYTATRYAIDCDNVLSRGLAMAYHDGDGKIIDSVENPEPRWSPIATDSIGMEKYKLICER